MSRRAPQGILMWRCSTRGRGREPIRVTRENNNTTMWIIPSMENLDEFGTQKMNGWFRWYSFSIGWFLDWIPISGVKLLWIVHTNSSPPPFSKLALFAALSNKGSKPLLGCNWVSLQPENHGFSTKHISFSRHSFSDSSYDLWLTVFGHVKKTLLAVVPSLGLAFIFQPVGQFHVCQSHTAHVIFLVKIHPRKNQGKLWIDWLLA